MEKKVFKWFFLVVLMPLLVMMIPQYTFAEEAGIAFTYRIEKPSNQLDKDIGYFDLMMTPNQEQKLEISLTNLSDKELTVQTVLDSAKTNSNGVIEYNQTKMDTDESLAIDFTSIVSTEKEIVLQAKETKNLEVMVKMPEISFNGVVAGGLTLKAKESADNETSTNGSRVKNEYAYVVAILLRENNDEVKPDLGYRKTYAGDQNYNNTIFTRIANIVPKYEKNVTLEAQISKSGSKEVLYEGRQTGIQMAPNSYIDFPISMNNDGMVPGTYVAKVKAFIDSQAWEWEEEFEITKEEAEKYNEKNSSLTQDSVNWKLIILLVGGFLVITLIVSLVYYFVFQKKKANKSKKGMKKNGQKKKRKLKSDL